MPAHDIVPPSEILAELQGVLSTLEDRIRWQLVRARNADLMSPSRASWAQQQIVDASAILRQASGLLLAEIRENQQEDEYREAFDRG